MKLPHRLALAALLGVPLTLFFVAKRASDERPVILGNHWGCTYLAFSPDGGTLISAPNPTSLVYPTSSAGPPNILWNLQTGKQYRVAQRQGTQEFMVFSPDGKYLADVSTSYDREDEVSIVSTDTGQIIKRRTVPQPRSISFAEGNVLDAAWTNDSSELIVLGPRCIRRLSSENGRSLNDFEYQTFNSYFDTSALSPDGALVAYTDIQKRTKTDWTASRAVLVDTHTKVTQTRIPIFSFASRPTFSPKSQFIALDAGYHIEFVSIKSRKVLWRWTGLDTTVCTFRFAANEKSVVLCNGSNCVARDMQDGHELWRLKNVHSTVFALSPDGKTLAEASNSGKLLLWPLPQTN